MNIFQYTPHFSHSPTLAGYESLKKINEIFFQSLEVIKFGEKKIIHYFLKGNFLNCASENAVCGKNS